MTDALAERIVLHLIKDFPDGWGMSHGGHSIGVLTFFIEKQVIEHQPWKYVWLNFYEDRVRIETPSLLAMPSIEYSNPNFFDDLREEILGPPSGSQRISKAS